MQEEIFQYRFFGLCHFRAESSNYCLKKGKSIPKFLPSNGVLNIYH